MLSRGAAPPTADQADEGLILDSWVSPVTFFRLLEIFHYYKSNITEGLLSVKQKNEFLFIFLPQLLSQSHIVDKTGLLKQPG